MWEINQRWAFLPNLLKNPANNPKYKDIFSLPIIEGGEIVEGVCHDVEIGPHLQPLQGETFALKSTTTEDDARLDIKANGLRESRFNKTNFDEKNFNPLAKTCRESKGEAYKYHESIKKYKYGQRITEVEKATFCPLVFVCNDGAGASSSKTMQQLVSKLSSWKEDSYADIISYLRTKISFALTRISILCIRGSRKLSRRKNADASKGVVIEEGRLLVCLIYFRLYLFVF